jgi:hypothetical protein
VLIIAAIWPEGLTGAHFAALDGGKTAARTLESSIGCPDVPNPDPPQIQAAATDE